MNMYYINPNNYGEEFFVMAESKEKAYEYLKAHLKKIADDNLDRYHEIYQNNYNKFKDKLPEDYTIDEYQEGEVVETYNG